MAIKQTNANRDFDVQEYVIDTEADVEDLPTNIGWGSSALCIENSKVYMLNSSQEWIELGASS